MIMCCSHGYFKSSWRSQLNKICYHQQTTAFKGAKPKQEQRWSSKAEGRNPITLQSRLLYQGINRAVHSTAANSIKSGNRWANWTTNQPERQRHKLWTDPVLSHPEQLPSVNSVWPYTLTKANCLSSSINTGNRYVAVKKPLIALNGK